MSNTILGAGDPTTGYDVENSARFFSNTDLDSSEKLGKQGLYLPLGDHVSEKDQEFIADKVQEFCNK